MRLPYEMTYILQFQANVKKKENSEHFMIKFSFSKKATQFEKKNTHLDLTFIKEIFTSDIT